MMEKNQKGIAAILPVLIVLGVLVLGLTISSVKKNSPINSQTKVLAESSDESTGGSSESVDTHETVDTPEPADTPEPETETESEIEVSEGGQETKVKIQKGDTHFEYQNNGGTTQVQGSFPLSVDSKTSQLTASTSAGVKTITTLPTEATQNLLNQGVLSNYTSVHLATDSNGQLIYEINGVKYKKLLGIFNVTVNKTGQVSAQNGQIIGINQSFLSKLLDTLSF